MNNKVIRGHLYIMSCSGGGGGGRGVLEGGYQLRDRNVTKKGGGGEF